MTILIISLLLAGCRHKGEPSGRLYFEPPARLLDTYAGMMEVDELNWAWTQPGFRLGNYPSLYITPLVNLSGVGDGGIDADIYEGLKTWCDQAGIQLSDDAQLSCEGAIVELKTERTFFEKISIFAEDRQDFLLEAEFIIQERPTRNILCKIRHGVTASEREQLASLFLSGLTRYFEAHR